MTLSVDLAATIAAVAGLVTVIGNLVLQIMQIRGQREAREGRVKPGEKVDIASAKDDHNRELTQGAQTKDP